MHILFLALLMQQNPPAQTITAPVTSTVAKKIIEATPKPVPQLEKRATNTTPSISTNEESIHLGMEKDISGQGEALGELKEKVHVLEEKREKTDRPDIDSLQLTRTQLIWLAGIAMTILGTLGALILRFGGIVWQDSIKPRLRREILESTPPVDSN